MASMFYEYDGSTCIILGDTLDEAEELGEDVAALSETLTSKKVSFHLFDRTPSTDHPEFFERTCNRLSILSELRNRNESSMVISTTLDAILGSCPVIEQKEKSDILLERGKKYSFQKLLEILGDAFDYSSEIICEEPGQFAVRGGLIDIYPVNGNHPVRIDFFGDLIDDIRGFDPTSQRSSETLSSVLVSSISEAHTREKSGEFFKYLPTRVFWFFPESEKYLLSNPLALHRADSKEAEQSNLSMAWERASCQGDFFLSASEIDAGAGIFQHSPKLKVRASSLVDPIGQSPANANDWGIESTLKTDSRSLFLKLKKYKEEGFSVFIASGTDSENKRIKSLIDQHQFQNIGARFIEAGLRDGFIYQSESSINDLFGLFINTESKGMVLATAREILGRERSRRPLRTRKAIALRREVDQALDFSELIKGDYLVHLQHGVCLFECLGKIDQDGIQEEAITVEFCDGILLHVPLQESHLLSRYVGLKKAKPKLAKLGGKSWARVRQSAELAAIDLAADLLRLQAARDSEQGHAFPTDDQWQKEFEDAFPYTETPDQLAAIRQVKQDMERTQPMDRLVCGDVGYGKTEVAMRAAFKAIMDGKQVALLSPTTILCQQHFQSFCQRMSDFPVKIEVLSRFRTTGQQRRILEDVFQGKVDLLIGTHRMLGNDVRFKDLGLIVIDEEQRFGVEHKERLKRFRSNVDILTLSATPIPRTLYFAMVGARSLSTIETPPSERRPIRTEVVKGDRETIRRAIETETRRKGQVFYLHNRVKTIESVAKKLRLDFPNLRIGVGHGQMPEEELEEVMRCFVAGEMDLLVCTTIIESGLDIPNCNTIIIDGADKFGLSQLYQLRGRVGRFTRQAYAYLLVNHANPVSYKARKRLSALRESKSMGAGFRIALRDLELRGSGNLLGSEQSGHIAGVGFELYCRLLRQSVSRLRGEELSLRPSATVRIDFIRNSEQGLDEGSQNKMFLSSVLPESYIAEPRLRIEAYRKLASFLEISEIQDFRNELNDRYGSLPECVKVLLDETEIRCLAEQAGFDRVETKQNSLYLRYVQKGPNRESKYLRVAGHLPCLCEKNFPLRLKEIIKFLKIHINGNTK